MGEPLVARSARVRFLAATMLAGVAAPAVAQDGAAPCDSLCVAATELVQRFELREGAAPVRERAGWERPKKIVVADVPLADYPVSYTHLTLPTILRV